MPGAPEGLQPASGLGGHTHALSECWHQLLILVSGGRYGAVEKGLLAETIEMLTSGAR